MRQVPHYLIVGNGRVSKHFQYYFSLLNVSFSLWHRPESTDQFYKKISLASHVLLLISDHAIEDFINQYLGDIKIKMHSFFGQLGKPERFWHASFNDI